MATSPPQDALFPSETTSTAATKRPTAKVVKKGVAKKPASTKKRKADGGTTIVDPTTSKKANSKASKSSKARRTSQSGGPQASDHVQESEVSDSDDVEDPNVVYCICRKPDNHTWMIGCDGGCDDWFHGACVDRKPEEKDLLDRFICPNCTANGAGVTTWKPMCRRSDCNRPARLKKDRESKYCSDECGAKLWAGFMENSNALLEEQRKEKLKPRSGFREHPLAGPHSRVSDEEYFDPMGGPVRTSQIKTLLDFCSDIGQFRRLGDSEPFTPSNSRPGTARMGEQDLTGASQYTDYEKERLAEIMTHKSKLRDTRMRLKQRDELVRLARERANRLKEKEGNKNVCGYDPRLAWSEAAYAAWLETIPGKLAVENGTLSPVQNMDDTSVVNDADNVEICKRKHCSRHGGWQKLALQDLRHEEQLVREEMEGAVGEEQERKRTAEARNGIAVEDEGSIDVAEE